MFEAYSTDSSFKNSNLGVILSFTILDNLPRIKPAAPLILFKTSSLEVVPIDVINTLQYDKSGVVSTLLTLIMASI